MNANFLFIIKRIISEQGESILADPQRLKSFVSDYAKNEPKMERLAFGRCIECGAYTELKKAPPGGRSSVKGRLAQKLHNEEGLDPALCAEALDLLEAVLWRSPLSSAALPYPQVSVYRSQTSAQSAKPVQPAYTAPAAPQPSYYNTPQPGQIQTNAMLRKAAREQLRGSWLSAAGMVFVWICILTLISFTAIGYVILCGPLVLGMCGYFLDKARGRTVTLGTVFSGFNMFGQGFLLNFLTSILIILWSCLLIIPGIIKSLSYSMAYYIVLDNPQMNALDAITASRRMMQGYKSKLFCLYFSFFGWFLLCILSLGIGCFWLIPYMQLSEANFYEDLKKNGIL
jgi:uncharacterized membrane protein